MPRRVPAPPAKGTRHPGAGRVKGTPNRISVEARLLASQLVNDVAYQMRLRRDFQLRRVHPTIESLLWQYHLGKPRQPVDITATLDTRRDDERRALLALDVRELEALAAESQALMDRALALGRRSQPQDVVVTDYLLEVSEETLGKSGGSDNTPYVNQPADLENVAVTHGSDATSADLPAPHLQRTITRHTRDDDARDRSIDAPPAGEPLDPATTPTAARDDDDDLDPPHPLDRAGAGDEPDHGGGGGPASCTSRSRERGLRAEGPRRVGGVPAGGDLGTGGGLARREGAPDRGADDA